MVSHMACVVLLPEDHVEPNSHGMPGYPEDLFTVINHIPDGLINVSKKNTYSDKTHINECLKEDQLDALLNVANIGARNYKVANTVQVEALKCLCNLVFQSTNCQEMCLRNAAVEGIVNRLKTYKEQMIEYEIYYFDMKLLFLITALNPNVRTKVRDDYHGLTYLVETLDLIIKSNDTKELFVRNFKYF